MSVSVILVGSVVVGEVGISVSVARASGVIFLWEGYLVFCCSNYFSMGGLLDVK